MTIQHYNICIECGDVVDNPDNGRMV